MHLTKILNHQLGWNKARVNLLSNIIIALLKTRTVCLVDIATALKGRAKQESKYKQLQRFFRFFEMDMNSISRMIASLIPKSKQNWTIAIDRTNWKFGKANINILCLGICYMGVSFPIIWVPLNKRGNSNSNERIALLKQFTNLFGLEKLRCLTADREFIGYKWFSYLLTHKIPFRIRIKDNFIVTSSKGNQVPIKVLFRNLKIGCVRILKRPRKICGVKVYIVGSKLPSGEYILIVTDKHPESAMDDYLLRWEIETLFACLKTRGFNFEATHITKLERIEKLTAVLAIAFCWCHITGEWLHQQKPIKIKKHGRRITSIFKHGLNWLREIVLNPSDNRSRFNKVIRLLDQRLNHEIAGAG